VWHRVLKNIPESQPSKVYRIISGVDARIKPKKRIRQRKYKAFLETVKGKVYKYGLLTKRKVKMAGYWPSSFFACLWTETKSRSINTQKKNEANIQPFRPNKLGQQRIYYTG